MLKKKFFAKALAFAMATGLMATAAPIGAAAPAVVAQAAEIAAPSKVEVDYENFALKVTVTADDKFLQLEVLKDEAGSKVSATYVYTLSSKAEDTIIDLSFLKPSKAQYLRVSTKQSSGWSKSKTVTVNQQPGKLSAKYKASESTAEGRLNLTINKKAVTDLSKLEYRGLYGSEFVDAATATPATPAATDLTIGKLDLLAVTGTTLVMRAKAVNETAADKVKDNAPAGAEVKVKIPAMAKAPKVSLDYAKGLISLPKGVEISKDGTTWKAIGDSAVKWPAATLFEKAGNTPASGSTAAADAAKGFSVLVRTAKTKKKAASNFTIFTVPGAPAVSVTGSTAVSGIYPATDKAVVEILKEAGGTDKLDGKVTIEKTAYEAGKGESFKFKVEGASFDFSMDEGKTWKTIKDGKDFVVYGDKDVQTLQVRRSGIKAKNAADSVMASAEVKFSIPKKTEAPKVSPDTTATAASGNTVVLARDNNDKSAKVTVTGTDYKWFYLEGSKWEKLVTKVFSVKEKFSLTVYAVKGEELASDAVTITLEPAE